MKQPPWYEGRVWNGIGLRAWLRLLVKNRFAVSPSRLPMAATMTSLAAINSSLGLYQRLLFGKQIREMEIPPDPVFIIGHWRSGTTMLHELLSLDPANRVPTTFESLSPHHFLVSERTLRRWLWFALPKTRPMDNMRVGWDKAQEDEVALSLLGAPSTFLTVAFPNRPLQDPEAVTLEEMTPAQRARWEQTFRRFLQTLLVKRSGRLVLKSPQHTFRLRQITRMFPQARFIHIVRDPRSVIPSTAHFWWSMYQVHGLQVPRREGLDEFVLKTFAEMHEEYEQTQDLIPPERLYELKYEDLVVDPVATVGQIYDYFGWPGLEAAEPALKQYAARSERYQTNKFNLTPELTRQIAHWCRPYCEKFGYPVPSVEDAVPAETGR
jgi:hypothetical protein